jgi:hypothetical protein
VVPMVHLSSRRRSASIETVNYLYARCEPIIIDVVDNCYTDNLCNIPGCLGVSKLFGMDTITAAVCELLSIQHQMLLKLRMLKSRKIMCVGYRYRSSERQPRRFL